MSALSALKSGLFKNVDRAVSWRFLVEVDGVQVGEFVECNGLGAERDTETILEGGSLTGQTIPGRVTESNITLKHGILDLSLWEWFGAGDQAIFPEVRNLSIVLADTSGQEVRRWDVTGVYPAKWTGVELTAESNSLAFETLELVRSGSSSGGGGGGGAGGDKEAEKLDVDDLRWEQLSAIADNVLHQIRRDLWMERERIGL